MEYENLTFDDDLLERKEFVKNLTNIIDGWNNFKHENNSLVLSIDAPWGSGKSYLMNMWKNWLISDDNSEKNYFVTYYNAWENDDFDNPFIPLIYKLQQIEASESNSNSLEGIITRADIFIKACTFALIKDGVKKLIGNETYDILNSGLESAAKVSTIYDGYENYTRQKKDFRDSISSLIPTNGKLIIFVDELDRCRPTFAIETLEIIKHYFNIDNIVFILAIDLKQLSHSVKTLYGTGMDSSGYLRRFFELNINIPSDSVEKYTKLTFSKVIEQVNLTDKFLDIAVNLNTKLQLSLRDIDKILNNFTIFCLYNQSVINDYKEHSSEQVNLKLEVYLYFLTLKYKHPDIYNIILDQGFIAYDNSPANWYVLEMRYFISSNISNMLKDIQTNKANVRDNVLINKYGFGQINSINLSFSEHIQRTIEMFT